MTPHFVITKRFDGKDSFAVEFAHSCMNITGQAKPHTCYALPEDIAALPLDVLIRMYKDGVRPKSKPLIPQSKKE